MCQAQRILVQKLQKEVDIFMKVNVLHLIIMILLFFNCEGKIVKSNETNKNREDFEAVWNAVNSVYPLLEYKQIDWENIYTEYSLRVEEARGDEFNHLLIALLGELKDAHIYYKSEGGWHAYPYLSSRVLRDKDTYSPFVVRKYFDKELQIACNGKIEFEILDDNIGYIYIATFLGEGMMNEFYIVMNFIKNTKGLILDVRNNTGGIRENREKVMSRFIEAPIEEYKAFTKGAVPYYQPPIEPDRRFFRYTKPVVVLTNGACVSEGDIFAEMMKRLPAVTTVGDTTAGACCNDIAENIKGEYILPSGKFINISTTYVVRQDGIPIEWNGVPPDVRVPQTKEDIARGRDKQLEYAIELLR